MRHPFWMLLFFISSSSFAWNDLSFGLVAQNITEPLEVVSGFVSVGCLIVGLACLFASLVKFFEYRRNPLAIQLSTVVWLFIIGLLLLILPFAYIITENGIPFSVLWGGVS